MIRRSEEKQSVRKPAPFNGVGEITVRSLLNGPATADIYALSLRCALPILA